MVLDSPTSSLDWEVARKVMENLRGWDCGFVLASNDVKVLDLCDKVIYLENGVCSFYGNVRDVDTIQGGLGDKVRTMRQIDGQVLDQGGPQNPKNNLKAKNAKKSENQVKWLKLIPQMTQLPTEKVLSDR